MTEGAEWACITLSLWCFGSAAIGQFVRLWREG